VTALVDEIRKLRRQLKDSPDRTFVQDNPLVAGNGTLTLPAGDASKFATSGVTIEFDDGTDEECLTTSAADQTANTVPIHRGMNGTISVDHTIGTTVLIKPRWGYAELAEALTMVVDDELWPHVWVAGEVPVTPDFTKEYIPAPVAGIEELVYGYQLQSGFRYPVHLELLSDTLADDTNFPNGAILIDRSQYVNTSPVYIAYRVRATITTLTPALEHLALMGAAGHLLMLEEAKHVAPASSAIDRRIGDGAKIRAGLVLWQRFEQARIRENISLSHKEQQRRRVIVRG
jgi:hypothetical protein